MKRSICLFYLLLFYQPMLERKAAYWLIGGIFGAQIDYLKYKDIDLEIMTHKKGIKGKLDRLVINTFYREEEKRRKVRSKRIQST